MCVCVCIILWRIFLYIYHHVTTTVITYVRRTVNDPAVLIHGELSID